MALVLNGNEASAVLAGDGPSAFPATLADGATYIVTALIVPSGHACSIERDKGSVAGVDLTDVAVHCPSTDAELTGLSIAGGPLVPTFTAERLEYSATVHVPVNVTTAPIMTVTTSRRRRR